MKYNSIAGWIYHERCAYVPQIFPIQSGTLLLNSSIGWTLVEFIYRTEKSDVLIDSLYPDCWKRDAIGVGALQYEGAKAAYYSSSRYIQFNGLQGQRATKLVKFWRLVTDGDTSLPA